MSDSPITSVSPDSLAQAVALLRSGEVIGMPTETVYGLAGDGLNPEALARIFAVKERPLFDPLILHVATPELAWSLTASIPDAAKQLADAFWPGAITLVLPKAKHVPDLATSSLPSVALRVPAHPLAQQLLEAFGGPLAAPSANRFGRISPTSAHAVAEELGQAIPLILDGGPCDIGLESTVVGFDKEGPIVLRAGGITLDDLASVLGQQPRRAEKTVEESSPSAAPGQLASHYAPRKPLFLADSIEHAEALGQQMAEQGNNSASPQNLGLLALEPAREGAPLVRVAQPVFLRALADRMRMNPHILVQQLSEQGVIKSVNQQVSVEVAADICQRFGFTFELCPPDEAGAFAFSRSIWLPDDATLSRAASRFFQALRELDNDDEVDALFAVRFPERGLGIALNDRLTRAAANTSQL